MYKCAIIGASGGRARGHAEVYGLVRRGRLVAVSSRNAERMNAFAESFGIAGRYTDYREMFSRERPDLVHVNTPPTVRAEVMAAANEANIPALIVEKPIAVEGEDYTVIAGMTAGLRMKVAINHQLHFHPNRTRLQALVREGAIGEVLLLEATARLNATAQGTHMLQSIGALNPGAKAISVLAQAAGTAGLQAGVGNHRAPDNLLASIAYDSGARGFLQCGPQAPIATNRESASLHKRIAVYGTCGRVHWTMWNWESVDKNGRHESGEHDYFEQDLQGQAALTEAMFDWMEDDCQEHPLNLASALADYNTLMGMYVSAINHCEVSLPMVPPENLLDSLRLHLQESGKEVVT